MKSSLFSGPKYQASNYYPQRRLSSSITRPPLQSPRPVYRYSYPLPLQPYFFAPSLPRHPVPQHRPGTIPATHFLGSPAPFYLYLVETINNPDPLNYILIAILLLVSLDLIFVRPIKRQARF
ncbi:MAG: hypothetical protein ACOX7U_05955 [Desulfitobacteriia bacterium]